MFFIWYGFAAADKLQHILGQQKVCLRTKNDMRTQNSVGNRLGQSRQAELYCQMNEDKYIWGLTENLLCSPVREFSITGPRVDLRSLFWTQAGSFNLFFASCVNEPIQQCNNLPLFSGDAASLEFDCWTAMLVWLQTADMCVVF